MKRVLRIRKVTKEEYNLDITRGKVFLLRLDELSNYYLSCFAQKIKYITFISVK